MLSLMFWSVTCYAFTGPEGANWNRSERKVWKSFLLYILYNENSAELTRFCSTLANWKTFVVFLVFSKIFHPSHMKLCNFRTPFLSLIGRSRYCYAGSNVRNFGPGEWKNLISEIKNLTLWRSSLGVVPQSTPCLYTLWKTTPLKSFEPPMFSTAEFFDGWLTAVFI